MGEAGLLIGENMENTRRRGQREVSPRRVLVGTICLQSAFIGLSINCMGVLLAAVQKDMGYSASQLALYYTVRGLTAAVCVAPVFALFRRRGKRDMIGAMGLLCGLSLAAMGTFTKLWMFYIAAVLTGVGSCISTILVPYIIGAWFPQRRGLALGIALSASGVAGALYNPVCGWIVERFGWRIAANVLGITVCLLTVIPCIFLVRLPELSDSGEKQRKRSSFRIGENLPVFCWILIIGLVTSGCTTLANQLPLISASYGYATMVGATMTSIAMIGNVGGKILMGAAMDRLGVHRTGKFLLAIVGAGLLLQCAGSENIVYLYTGTAMYGLNYAAATVLLSQLCIVGFGEKLFSEPMSRITSIDQIATAAISPIVASSYDMLGTFVPAMAVCALSCFICIPILWILQRRNWQTAREQEPVAARSDCE